MQAVNQIAWLLIRNAWYVWPLSVYLDLLISKVLRNRSFHLATLRWIPRLIHATVAAAVFNLPLLDYLLGTDKVHRHTDPPALLIALVVFYTSTHLVKQFDKPLRTHAHRSFIWTFILPAILTCIVIFAAIIEVFHLKLLPFGPGEPMSLTFFIVPPILLLTLSMSSRFFVTRYHLIFHGTITALFMIGFTICFIAADFKFLGLVSLKPDYFDDDIWYITATGFVAAAILLTEAMTKKIIDKPPHHDQIIPSSHITYNRSI